MKILVNISLIILAGSLILSNNYSYAQERSMKYNVRALGMDVGVLSVTEQVNDQDIIIEAVTDVKVRIVFTFRVQYIQKSLYREGKLHRSSLHTYKKGRLNSSTELISRGNGYTLIKDGDTSFVNSSIEYSGSLLYFHEPANIEELYYEISGEKKPLQQLGNNKYMVIDPKNKRESHYEYEGGILQRSSVEHGLTTIYTERLAD